MSSPELNPDEEPWKIEAEVVGYGKMDPNERVVLEHERLCRADYSGRKLRYLGVVGWPPRSLSFR